LKRNNIIKIAKRHLKRRQTSESSATRRVLIVLWLGTFCLLAFMILRWAGDIDFGSNLKGKKPSVFFVDDVLLSSSDLKLDSTSALINISLNTESRLPRPAKSPEKQLNPVSRDELYRNIFNQKMKKAESRPSDDFEMEPLPE